MFAANSNLATASNFAYACTPNKLTDDQSIQHQDNTADTVYDWQQIRTLRYFFSHIDTDTSEFQMAILPFLNAHWAENADVLIATIQSFADKFKPDIYKACIATIKYYMNGRDFSAPGRFETISYFGGEIKWQSETLQLKSLNERLDVLHVTLSDNSPKHATSWSEWRKLVWNKHYYMITAVTIVVEAVKGVIGTSIHYFATDTGKYALINNNESTESSQVIENLIAEGACNVTKSIVGTLGQRIDRFCWYDDSPPDTPPYLQARPSSGFLYEIFAVNNTPAINTEQLACILYASDPSCYFNERVMQYTYLTLIGSCLVVLACGCAGGIIIYTCKGVAYVVDEIRGVYDSCREKYKEYTVQELRDNLQDRLDAEDEIGAMRYLKRIPPALVDKTFYKKCGDVFLRKKNFKLAEEYLSKGGDRAGAVYAKNLFLEQKPTEPTFLCCARFFANSESGKRKASNAATFITSIAHNTSADASATILLVENSADNRAKQQDEKYGDYRSLSTT